MTVTRSTNRWRGISAGAMAALGLGLVLSRPSLLLASVVVVAYAAAARSATAPDPELVVDRDVDAEAPDPGDVVPVTTTVTNEGGTLLDLRLFDGVPEELAVTGGVARACVALRPGSAVTMEYAVTAEGGEHTWGPVTAVARDASGAREREVEVPAPATTVTSVPRLESAGEFPLRALTTPHTGQVTSREPGAGVEFHSLREYRPGDPMGHVDWNNLARTGELATREFHAERMAAVVLLFDVRPAAYVGRPDLEGNAVAYSLAGGRRLFGRLLDDNNQVGLAGIGAEICWLAPGMGREHRTRAEQFLATTPELSRTPPEGTFLPSSLLDLRSRLRGERQVIWFSPVVDRYGVEIPRRLESAGHAVTVVSPDLTDDGTPGRRLAAADRRLRLDELRGTGMRVVDWRPPAALDVALVRAERGWR